MKWGQALGLVDDGSKREYDTRLDLQDSNIVSVAIFRTMTLIAHLFDDTSNDIKSIEDELFEEEDKFQMIEVEDSECEEVGLEFDDSKSSSSYMNNNGYV